MTAHKDNHFSSPCCLVRETLRLHKMIPHFPWDEWCLDEDFAMPYPEIIACSDYAHAKYIQISGLLVDFTFAKNNTALVSIQPCKERECTKTESYIISIEPQLGDVSEVWEAIGIDLYKLRHYVTLMVLRSLEHEAKQFGTVNLVKTPEQGWLLNLERK